MNSWPILRFFFSPLEPWGKADSVQGPACDPQLKLREMDREPMECRRSQTLELTSDYREGGITAAFGYSSEKAAQLSTKRTSKALEPDRSLFPSYPDK